MTLGVLALAGCQSVMPDGVSVPGPLQTLPGMGQDRPRTAPGGELRNATELQAALFGYADTYISVVSEAADKLVDAAETPELRAQAIRMKLEPASDAVKIVTGPNPTVALMDFAVMVTVQRRVWDEYWAVQVFSGPSGQAYTDAMRRMDREIWRIVGQSISENDAKSLQELAGNIRRWYRAQVYVTSIRASSVTKNITEQQDRPATSLLSLFGMDPLAGLSPAVMEATKSRLLAERVFYYAQKAPTLLSWRSQLLLAETAKAPESERVLANIDSAATSARRFADVAEQLPEDLRGHVDRVDSVLARERTLWLEGVTQQRAALLEAFDERHEQAREIMIELRRTVEAADELSRGVQGVLAQVRELSESDEPRASEPRGRPFDILEYERTLATATGTVRELNSAVGSARAFLDSPAWEERELTIARLTSDVERSGVRLIVYASAGLAGALFVGLTSAFAVRHWFFTPRRQTVLTTRL